MGSWEKFLPCSRMKPDKQHWDAETLLPKVLFHPKGMSKNIFFAPAAARALHCLNPWSEKHLPAETSNSISFHHTLHSRRRNPSTTCNHFRRPTWKMCILYTAICNLWETESEKQRALNQSSGRGECETSGIATTYWDPIIPRVINKLWSESREAVCL